VFLLVPLLWKLSFDYYINLGDIHPVVDVQTKRTIFSAINVGPDFINLSCQRRKMVHLI
jgi:hypothetical protein